MKQHLLVLADPFSKPSYAPRLRSICEYLTAIGTYEVEVFTEQMAPLTFAHDYPIREIALYRMHNTAEWLLKGIYDLLTGWKERTFSRKVRVQIANRHYDAVFCTTFSSFPLGTARAIAQERHIPLHVDIRDIDEQIAGHQYIEHRQAWLKPFRRFYSNINRRRRNRVLRAATQITTVSPWHTDFIKHFNPNTHLIYNGYDARLFVPHDMPTDTFRIVYTGRIYESELQDPTSLFEAIRTIHDITVAFYTNNAGRKRIQRLAQAFDVEAKIELHPYVPFQQIPKLLHSASIILVLANKTDAKGPHGVLTTKFFEALGVEKPVLCIRSDEALLANLISETHAGMAATNADEVARFILEKQAEWRQNGFTRQHVTGKERFARQTEAATMERLLQQMMKP